MKKFVIVLLSIAMLFSFASCNNSPAVEAYDPEIAASYMFDMFFGNHKVGGDIDNSIVNPEANIKGLDVAFKFVDGSGADDWVNAIVTFNGYELSDGRIINSGVLRIKASGAGIGEGTTLTVDDITYTTREGDGLQPLSISDEYGTHQFDFNIYVTAATGSAIELTEGSDGVVNGASSVSLLIKAENETDLTDIITSNVFAIDGNLVQHSYLINALAELLSDLY